MDTSGLNVILAERLRITFGNDTQEVISRKLNMTQGNVSKLINGQQMPTVDTLLLISKAYKVSVDWLMGISDQPEIDGLVINKVSYEQIARMLDRLIEYNSIEIPDLISVVEENGIPIYIEQDENNGEQPDFEPIYDSDYIKIKDRLLSYLMRRRDKLAHIDLEMLDIWKEKLDKFHGIRLLENTHNMQEVIDSRSPAQFKDGDWVSLVEELGKMSNEELEKIVDEIRKKEGKE